MIAHVASFDRWRALGTVIIVCPMPGRQGLLLTEPLFLIHSADHDFNRPAFPAADFADPDPPQVVILCTMLDRQHPAASLASLPVAWQTKRSWHGDRSFRQPRFACCSAGVCNRRSRRSLCFSIWSCVHFQDHPFSSAISETSYKLRVPAICWHHQRGTLRPLLTSVKPGFVKW